MVARKRPEGPDLRLLGPALACWAGAALGISGWTPLWLPALLLGVLLILTILIRRRLAAATAACGLVACLIAGCWVWVLSSNALARLGESGAIAVVQVRTRGDAKPLNGLGAPRVLVNVTVLRIEARSLAWRAGLPATLVGSREGLGALAGEPGATWWVTVKVAPAQAGERSAARLTATEPGSRVRGPGPADRMVSAVRRGLHESMAGQSAEVAGLVPALVVGDVSALPGSVVEDFRATGLTHLTAVSGTNLTLMLSAVWMVAGWLGLFGRPRNCLSLALVVAFVLVCRSEPSVLRAAAMGVVALAAVGARGDPGRGIRALCVACGVLLLADPWLARSWGFALSVCATAGILLLAGRWQRVMRGWAPGPLAEAVCVPLAAQLATMPLTVALSGSISVAGLLANVLAGPFVAPVTILGLITALLAPWAPGAAGVLARCAGWSAEPLVVIARLGARLPSATQPWRADPSGLVLISVVCLAGMLLVPRLLHRPAAGVASLVVLAVLACIGPVQPGWPGSWQSVSCDVGQGDATVIRSGEHRAVLVDAGPQGPATVRCLASLQVDALDAVILTHLHADHTGGLEEVLEAYPVGLIVTAQEGPGEPARRGLAALAAAHGVQVREVSTGWSLQVGQLSWQTLGAGAGAGATEPGEGESQEENDASLIGVARTGCLSVLIAGDAGTVGQQAVLERGADLRVDVLKLPHHGSSDQDQDFFAATGARVAVASAGAHNSYGHPTARTVALANRLGMRVLRTDQQGSIAIGCADQGTIRTQQ